MIRQHGSKNNQAIGIGPTHKVKKELWTLFQVFCLCWGIWNSSWPLCEKIIKNFLLLVKILRHLITT